jgi:hypothetical protein
VLTADDMDIVPKQEPEKISQEEMMTEQTSDPQQQQSMHISVQALSGKSSGDTIAVVINIGGKRGLALIDTGSTNTFIDMNFALKTNCEIH